MEFANTNSMESKLMNRSPATIAVETSILLLIGLIAIGGNLLVVISIYRNPSLRTITNYFVLSLAMTDILYPMLALPFTIFWSINDGVVVNQGMCDLQAIFGIGLSRVSIFTITLMAVNRFYRVCKPLRYRQIFSRRKSCYMIAVAWVLSFIITILLVKGNLMSLAQYDPPKIWCGISDSKKSVLSLVVLRISLFSTLGIPFIIITFCYARIFRNIRRHKRSLGPIGNGFRRRVCEIKITWTLFAVLMAYLVAWIPLLMVMLLPKEDQHKLPRQGHLMVTVFTTGNSAVNPIIYGVMNGAFRQEYKKISCR